MFSRRKPASSKAGTCVSWWGWGVSLLPGWQNRCRGPWEPGLAAWPLARRTRRAPRLRGPLQASMLGEQGPTVGLRRLASAHRPHHRDGRPNPVKSWWVEGGRTGAMPGWGAWAVSLCPEGAEEPRKATELRPYLTSKWRLTVHPGDHAPAPPAWVTGCCLAWGWGRDPSPAQPTPGPPHLEHGDDV